MSYRRFTNLSSDPSTGVFLRTVNFYFQRPVAETPQAFSKMQELKDEVGQFVHDASLIAANGVNPEFGMRDAYSHLAPMVDTDVYMAWLLQQVVQAGCRVLRHRISGNLRDQESSLKREFSVDVIVNCTGLGARELATDDVSPLRGAVVRVHNDATAMPTITQAHCISHDETNAEPHFIFIVPRGRDMLVLGGLAEPDQWNLDITLDNYEPLRRMYRQCMEFLPILKSSQIETGEPVRVGLRPFRRNHVRVEWEPGTSLVHNYGHGGSGVSYSWGCALDVADLVNQVMSVECQSRV